MNDPDAPHRVLERARKSLFRPIAEVCPHLRAVRDDLQKRYPTYLEISRCRRTRRPVESQFAALGKIDSALDNSEEALVETEDRFEHMEKRLDALRDKQHVGRTALDKTLPQLRAMLSTKSGMKIPIGKVAAPEPTNCHSLNGTLYHADHEGRANSPSASFIFPPPLNPLPVINSGSRTNFTQQVKKVKRFAPATERPGVSSPIQTKNGVVRHAVTTGLSHPLTTTQKGFQPPVRPCIPLENADHTLVFASQSFIAQQTPTKFSQRRSRFLPSMSASKANSTIVQSASRIPKPNVPGSAVRHPDAVSGVPSWPSQVRLDPVKRSSAKSQIEELTEMIERLRAQRRGY